MSFLTSLRMSSGRLVKSSYAIPATSAFHTTAMQRALKENDHNRDNLADHYENEKLAHIKKVQEGTGKWTENLASNSEADVKADRGEIDADSKDFQQMQELLKKKKKEAGLLS